MDLRGCNRGTFLSFAAQAALLGHQTTRYRVPWTVATLKIDHGGAARGRLAHRIRRSIVLWPDDGPPQLAAQYSCHSISADVVLGAAVEDRPPCVRCDWEDAHSGDQLTVYFAERDGLIKIGCSSNVLVRVAGLKARLLGIEEGGFYVERALHERFADLRQYGEWFRPDDVLIRYIADLTREAAAS